MIERERRVQGCIIAMLVLLMLAGVTSRADAAVCGASSHPAVPPAAEREFEFYHQAVAACEAICAEGNGHAHPFGGATSGRQYYCIGGCGDGTPNPSGGTVRGTWESNGAFRQSDCALQSVSRAIENTPNFSYSAIAECQEGDDSRGEIVVDISGGNFTTVCIDGCEYSGDSYSQIGDKLRLHDAAQNGNYCTFDTPPIDGPPCVFDEDGRMLGVCLGPENPPEVCLESDAGRVCVPIDAPPNCTYNENGDAICKGSPPPPPETDPPPKNPPPNPNRPPDPTPEMPPVPVGGGNGNPPPGTGPGCQPGAVCIEIHDGNQPPVPPGTCQGDDCGDLPPGTCNDPNGCGGNPPGACSDPQGCDGGPEGTCQDPSGCANPPGMGGGNSPPGTCMNPNGCPPTGEGGPGSGPGACTALGGCDCPYELDLDEDGVCDSEQPPGSCTNPNGCDGQNPGTCLDPNGCGDGEDEQPPGQCTRPEGCGTDNECDPATEQCGTDTSASGGVNCETPPQSSGHPILGAILFQEWKNRCTAERMLAELQALREDDGDGDGGGDGEDGTVEVETPGDYDSGHTGDQAWGENVVDEFVFNADGFLGGSRTCPGLGTHQFLGTTIQVDSTVMCTFFQWLGALVLIGGYIQGGYILASGGRA